MCEYVSNERGVVRSISFEKASDPAIQELLDPVGGLPQTIADRDEEVGSLVSVEDEILLWDCDWGVWWGAPLSAHLVLQVSEAFIAGHVIGSNFSLPLPYVSNKPQGDLPDGIVGRLQLEKVVGRGRGDGSLRSGLSIDCDDRWWSDFKDEVRGSNTSGFRHGFIRHLVGIVEQAEGVLVLAEEGVFQCSRL